MLKNIALFGGSFNPPTIGHYNISKFLLSKNYDVWLVPCGPRSDKSSLKTTFEHRFNMCQLMTKETDIEVKDFEKNLQNAYSTKQLLNFVKKKYPNRNFYFVIGSDLVKDIPNWDVKNWYKDFNFITIKRPSFTIKNCDLKRNIIYDLDNMNFSSSNARLDIDRAKNNCIPEVYNYIKKNNLYF